MNEARSSPRRRLFALGLLAAFLVGARHMPTGCLVVSPGAALPLAAQVTLRPLGSMPSGAGLGDAGDVLLLTVVAQRANVYQLVLAASGLRGPATIIRESQMTPPGMSPSEHVGTGQAQMNESRGLGAYLALREAGEPADCDGRGARVMAVYQGVSVVHGQSLQVGDLIVAVNGSSIELSGDVAPVLRHRSPGDILTLTVVRQAGEQDLGVRLGNVVLGAEESMLGALLLSEEPRFRLSRQVVVDTAGIRGPSGGLAIALAVYQALGVEDVLRGRIVAASGYVRRDGTVGPVGGSELKALAARRAGADILLVARGNVEQAVAAAPDLLVVAVDSFQQALEILRRGVIRN